MTYNPINFPGLGIGPFDFNPTAFRIFGLNIQWYGIIIALGCLIAMLYCSKRASIAGINSDTFIDAVLIAIPFAIIGARLYYVVFNFSQFRGNVIKIFNTREGGLAIYGAVIFAFITAYIFSRARKISPLALMDVASIGFLIGQSIGRWGNFANREVFGFETDLPWRMEVYSHEAGARIAVHPAFLYESLWNAAGFLLLNFLLSKRQYDGQILLMYIAWYGLGRGFIEGLRADTLYLFNTGLMVSQVLAYASCTAAIGLLVYFKFKKTKTPKL